MTDAPQRTTTKRATQATPRTITWDELNRLAFCNSPRLPQRVNVGGLAKQWVGIGWINVGAATPTDIVVLEDA